MKVRRSLDDILAAARAQITRHSPAEAWQAMATGGVLVDIRCEDDRRRHGVVPDSVHIPRTVLEWRADPDGPWRDERIARLDAALILMCSDGFSSSLAAASLCDLGFTNVGDVIGGFGAWFLDGLPVTTLDEPGPSLLPGEIPEDLL